MVLFFMAKTVTCLHSGYFFHHGYPAPLFVRNALSIKHLSKIQCYMTYLEESHYDQDNCHKSICGRGALVAVGGGHIIGVQSYYWCTNYKHIIGVQNCYLYTNSKHIIDVQSYHWCINYKHIIGVQSYY